MRQPVFVTDIANDPKWAKFKDLALAADLRACWSDPIPGHDGEAVGALALYFREPRIPLANERSLIAQFAEPCEIARRGHERVAERGRRASIDALTGLPHLAHATMALAHLPRDEPA